MDFDAKAVSLCAAGHESEKLLAEIHQLLKDYDTAVAPIFEAVRGFRACCWSRKAVSLRTQSLPRLCEKCSSDLWAATGLLTHYLRWQCKLDCLILDAVKRLSDHSSCPHMHAAPRVSSILNAFRLKVFSLARDALSPLFFKIEFGYVSVEHDLRAELQIFDQHFYAKNRAIRRPSFDQRITQGGVYVAQLQLRSLIEVGLKSVLGRWDGMLRNSCSISCTEYRRVSRDTELEGIRIVSISAELSYKSKTRL